jgi:hypothetical protein
MASPSTPALASAQPIRGRIIEAEVKVSVDATRPLPLACALYAIESSEGVWLCAYYGSNRSVFDYLPQKGGALDEAKLGIAFHTKEFISKEEYQPGLWEAFKKAHFVAYGGHED